MPPSMQFKHMTCRCPAEMYAQLEKLAKSNNMTVAALVRGFIALGLGEYNLQHEEMREGFERVQMALTALTQKVQGLEKAVDTGVVLGAGTLALQASMEIPRIARATKDEVAAALRENITYGVTLGRKIKHQQDQGKL